MNILNLNPPICPILLNLIADIGLANMKILYITPSKITRPFHTTQIESIRHSNIDGMLDPRHCLLVSDEYRTLQNFSEYDYLCALYQNEIHYLGHNDWIGV